jgi:hypothetical protein
LATENFGYLGPQLLRDDACDSARNDCLQQIAAGRVAIPPSSANEYIRVRYDQPPLGRPSPHHRLDGQRGSSSSTNVLADGP